MANFWNTPGVPHKGWSLIDVIDVREDWQSEEETDYKACMMCGNEKIRYVHLLEHPDIDEQFEVGCVCAEKMTNDYYNPLRREKELRNRTNRRNNWLKRDWRTSAKGNPFLKMDGHNIGIYYDKKTAQYKCRVDDIFGKKGYPTTREAKMALFKNVEYLKENGRW